MSENENEKKVSLDWDMADDYFNNDDDTKRTVRSLEEIMKESSYTPDGSDELEGVLIEEMEPKLVQTIEDVKRVKEASVGGATMDEIASRLSMDKEYVKLILMTLEGYAEDSIVATAHLVMLG